MSITLKEQLEALTIKGAPLRSHVNPSKAAPQQKPAWLEQAQYGIELLKAYFPECFKEMKDVKPLKIGIKQDLVKFLSIRADIALGDKACMVSSLSYYVSSAAYHRNMLEGLARIDLNGQPAGIVTQEEALYSKECRQTKLKKRKSPISSAKRKTDRV